MSSSELSNALNPHGIKTRSRASNNSYSSNLQPVLQIPQQHVPHRSELELAISEPPPAPLPPSNVRLSNPPANVQAFQELLRTMAANKEAHEIERKRRLVWEQEQEAKYTQRQAEMERQMQEMKQEIISLKSMIGLNSDRPANTRRQLMSTMSPLTFQQTTPQTSQSPMSNSSFPQSLPVFVQGSSSQPLPHNVPIIVETRSPDILMGDPPMRFVAVEGSRLHPEAPPSIPRKRPTPDPCTDGDDKNSDSETGSSASERPPRKRKNGHDTRILTLTQAVRKHFLRVMQIPSDKALPDSHIEGRVLQANEPIRFVWEKTPKQSVHNGRMKIRFIADIKANKRLYKHVSEKEFQKRALGSAFDQAFTTMRNKFKQQRDANAAIVAKKRDESKTEKARRMSRKKLKLSNRSEARNRIDAFEHITFDGALQIECMSSEESDVERDGNSSTNAGTVYRVRGLPWRSTRLRNFYSTLDDGDQIERHQRPKRGLGRKERCIGPPKEGFFMPPKGAASWMISRRWLNDLQTTNPELVELLTDIILVDPPGFDWNQFLALGGEVSDGGDDIYQNTQFGQRLEYAPNFIRPVDNNPSISSLHNALVTL